MRSSAFGGFVSEVIVVGTRQVTRPRRERAEDASGPPQLFDQAEPTPA
jgi:hypothetical protein